MGICKGCGSQEKGHNPLGSWPYLLNTGARKSEGGASATPAAPDALRVQTLRKQLLRFLGAKKKPACAGSILFLVPRRGKVVQARPRHPLHRMPFESCRCASSCFAFRAKKKPACAGLTCLVPRRGLEPPHLTAHGPEPCASTNSAIWAMLLAEAAQFNS